MKIAIASDHGGIHLRTEIIELLETLGHEYDDFGPHQPTSVDYPDYAKIVAEGVVNGQYDRGILICGTGIGMSIAANKITGVRCALVHDCYTARVTREHNDSNIIALGERVIGPSLAREIVDIWLKSQFEGGRHQIRIDKISSLEHK